MKKINFKNKKLRASQKSCKLFNIEKTHRMSLSVLPNYEKV